MVERVSSRASSGACGSTIHVMTVWGNRPPSSRDSAIGRVRLDILLDSFRHALEATRSATVDQRLRDMRAPLLGSPHRSTHSLRAILHKSGSRQNLRDLRALQLEAATVLTVREAPSMW